MNKWIYIKFVVQALGATPLSIMTYITMTISIMTISIMTFSIMTLSIKTLSLKSLSVIKHNEAQSHKV